MIINGVEFDIDFTDADVIERIAFKSDEVGKKADELEKNRENLSPAEGIRQECKIMKDFLDYVLGDGASEKIFGKKDSLNLCLSAYEDVINASQEQYQKYYEKVSKYSPDRLKR
jgi:hypothetical protein